MSEIIFKIKEVDDAIGYLLDELDRNNLLANMNIIMLSDHGMASIILPPLLIQKYVNSDLIDFNRSVLYFASSFYPKEQSKMSQLYDALHKLPNTKIYYKSEVPAEFHYSNSDRIGIFIVI